MPNGLSLADFKAVLFDVDGTLVDTLPAIVRGLGDTYEHFNGSRPSDAEIQATIGLPLTTQMRMFGSEPANAEEIEQRIDFAIHRLQSYAHLEQEYEPAVQTLKLVLQAGKKTALVTSKSRLELSLFAERVHWVQNVDITICASDVKTPKPNPESALLACERLDVSPADAVFIGDSVFDMQCASSAGLSAVAVGYGSGKKQALLDERPGRFFESPEDLLEWAKESIFRTPCLEGKT
jgi:HAD superfamily hydrolase (TIGR01549 family)